MHEHIEGLVAASFTAMNPDGSLNPGMIEKERDLLVRNKVAGVFVNGSTGESLSLSMQERLDIAKHWVDGAPDGFKVIIHCGHTSLVECKDLAAQAEKIEGALEPSDASPQ